MKSFTSLIGNKIKTVLLLSLPLGLFVGLIELLFAIGLNDVLISSNLIDGNKKLSIISNSFILLGFIGLLRFCFVFIAQFNTNLIFELINQKVREIIILKNYNYYDTISISKSQSFLNNISNKLAEFLNSISEIIVQSIVFFIIYFYLLKNSFSLTIYISIIFIILGVPLLLMKKKIDYFSNNFQQNVNSLIEKISKDLRNILFLKIIGSVDAERKKLLDHNKKSISPYIKYISRLTLLNQLPNLLGLIMIIIIIALNSKNNYIPPEFLVPYLYLVLRAIISFGHIVHNIGRVLFSIPYVKTFNSIKIKKNNLDKDDLEDKKIDIKDIRLVVKDLSFGYEDTIKTNINFKIDEGDFCLFTGPSGSGKTALIMTIIGLLNKKSGIVEWGGHNLENIKLKKFRQKIFYCGTDPFLIEGSVLDNLLYGTHNNELKKQEIINILKICKCEFLKINNEYNLDFLLENEGSGLSAGQKQRLSLARAIINNPQILILDEATVNIDEKNEYSILSKIREVRPRCMILAVSHRKSIESFATIKIDLT